MPTHESPTAHATDPVPTPAQRKRPGLGFALKLLFSVAMLAWIVHKVLARGGAEGFVERLAQLHWGWVAAAVAMQLIAIGFSLVRWQRLLVGQGLHAPWRFLGGSILIARFFGAFTPGGFTGFGGWRIYDVGKHSGKVARATATIGVEMILGQLAFGVVVMAGSVFGARFIGTTGVLLVNGAFLAIIVVGLTFLARPQLFRWVAGFLPAGVAARVQTLVDAVCAYQGKAPLLVQAALLGVGTHAFNNLIYVCAARALGVELGVGAVFFASSLQIFATLLPASINGIGLREAAAVALYTSAAVGLPMATAVLIPIVGFACEMFVSSFGALFFLARRRGYDAHIRVDDPDRERLAQPPIPAAPREDWPRIGRGAALGLGAGMLGGLLVGVTEGAVIAFAAHGRAGYTVLAYGALAYALFAGIGGACFGALLAGSGRLMRRAAMAPAEAYGRMAAVVTAGLAFPLTAFRLRRDYFDEHLKWKSLDGLLVLGGCLLAAVVLYLGLSWLLRRLTRRKPGSALLHPVGSVAAVAVAVVALGLGAAGLGAVEFGAGAAAAPASSPSAANARPGAPDVLFVVVDTLRASFLPAWGDPETKTPNLDAFAKDAVRFDQSFANASWTRPSFASMLTGRLPSSHGVMNKHDALPSALETLPEALHAGGYATAGFVTNYNIAPYFNFQQGFDTYHYLEPGYPIGDDASSKLLVVEAARKAIERAMSADGRVRPGMAYQDAATVNAAVDGWLAASPRRPWFAFVAYMDPHDPYYVHPYDGHGYARAVNPRPAPGEAPRLRRLYRGEIHYWDAEFGKLLQDLRRRGLYDDMLIVVTADHGEEFDDHGGYWHGTTLYDEAVHTPLYVKLPGNRRGGTVVRHWVQSIDLMPTLLHLLHLPVPEGVQGGDLFTGHDVVYAEESHEGNVLESVRQRRDFKELKLIKANPGNPRGLKPTELYDVADDPGELHDLAERQPETVREVRTTLEAQHVLARQGATTEHDQVKLTGEAAKRLEALGYISGSDDDAKPDAPNK